METLWGPRRRRRPPTLTHTHTPRMGRLSREEFQLSRVDQLLAPSYSTTPAQRHCSLVAMPTARCASVHGIHVKSPPGISSSTAIYMQNPIRMAARAGTK